MFILKTWHSVMTWSGGMGKGREVQLGGDICVVTADLLEQEMATHSSILA